MDEKPPHTIRRRILARGLGLTGACVLGIAIDARSIAAAKSPKAALLYQDHPRDGHRCGDCKFFNAAGNDAPTGTCALVDGTIDRNGWCMAFAPKT
ncbi:MAG TPA: high-potential iron-sulfur protein [Casimicrobiaceae bacterium]